MDDRPIVVGIDGSEASRRALEWAADRAATTNQRVRAVRAWALPRTIGAPDAVVVEQCEEQAGASAAEAVRPVFGDDDSSVDVVVVQGRAAEVLLDQAVDAGMVVLGSRGLGGFRGMMLGSVSNQVVHHAPCPVVVVREPTRPAGSA